MAAHGARFICPHSRDGYGNGQTSARTICSGVPGCSMSFLFKDSSLLAGMVGSFPRYGNEVQGMITQRLHCCYCPWDALSPINTFVRLTGLQYSWVDACQEGTLHPNTDNRQRVTPAFSPHLESNSLEKKYLYSPIICRRHLYTSKFRKGTHLHPLAPGPHP